jgi:uncharacterized LabA/DUF88 family protein
MTEKRAMLFVDAQNLIRGASDFESGGLNYDIHKLVEAVASDHDLIRSYWFDSYRPGEYENKENFFNFLETNGFRVEATELGGTKGDFNEKESDIRLATEVIAHGYNGSYDIAIIVTGDKDFIRAIQYVQDQGRIVEVVSFKDSMSGDLRRAADGYTHLDDIADAIRK